MIDLSPDLLTPAYDRETLAFRHDVTIASLTTEALGDVAATLPAGWTVVSPADLAFCEPRRSEAVHDGADRAVDEMASRRRSVRLYHLELVPEFRLATDELRATVERLAGRHDVSEVSVALFLAPPGAVTPAHPDRHHNLLLQLEGTKRVWVEDMAAEDPVARHRGLVDYFRCPGDGVADLPAATPHDLGPGDALYIPTTAFHWTEVLGDDRSVALSVGFSTAATIRTERASHFDSTLQRMGWRSRPPGRAKWALIDTFDRIRGRRSAA